jgi:hypothetical protein
MFKHFLHYLMFAFTMFAAGAPAVGGDGGGSDGAAGADGFADSGAGDSGSEIQDDGGVDDGVLSETADGDSAAEGEDQQDDAQQRQQQHEDKDTADFKGLVSKRLVALKKEAPELAAVFQKYPKVQEQVEAAFRRDMAYREVFSTPAEARQMREQFPNGMADVEQVFTELAEAEQLDKDLLTRDQNGEFPGHKTIISNIFQQDREAAVSLFKNLPKEWARLDPDSYNEVMGNIVGATLARNEVPQWLTELAAACDDPKNLPAIKADLAKLVRWANGYSKQKAAPTEEERRLQDQRTQFQRETQQREAQDRNNFGRTFHAESSKLQTSIIKNHPAIKDMLKVKNLSEQKKNDIVAKVQTQILQFLKTSRAWKAKINSAAQAKDLQKCLDLQKTQWSYPWILNKYVRQVLREETPNLVQRSRDAQRGSAAQRPPARAGQPTDRTQRGTGKERTGPYQESGQWFKKDGSRFTISELLRGAHLTT